MVDVDKEARYLESHEWAKAGDGNIVKIGLSAYAFEQLGDIVYIELPAVGTRVIKGQSFGVIESVKAASDMYAPVSGEVIEVNTEIQDKPDVLKTDAYEQGWFIKIEIESTTEYESLMDATAYEELIKSKED